MVRRWQTDLCAVSDENSNHENHKQLCRVLQAQLHIGYMSHHSKQFGSCHSVSLMLAMRTGALQSTSYAKTFKPTNKQTNRHGRLGGSRCTLFIHSQQAIYMQITLFVHKLWEKSKRYFLIWRCSKASQARQIHTAGDNVTAVSSEAQCNILFTSDTKSKESIFSRVVWVFLCYTFKG